MGHHVVYDYEVLQAVCRDAKKAGMLVEWSDDESDGWPGWLDEIKKAAPWMTDDDMAYSTRERAIVLFDTREEMEEAYGRTVGDDGPTETNSYNGAARVYALTCWETGELRNENT